MKKVMAAMLLLAVFATRAMAQQAEWYPPDQELWTQMSQAFAGLSMSMSAHQQVQQIMQQVEQQAKAKAAAKKAGGSNPPAPAPK
jgi:hypothetical protein